MDIDSKSLPLMIHPFLFLAHVDVQPVSPDNEFKPERVGIAIDPRAIVLWGNDSEFLRVADAQRGAALLRRWRMSLIKPEGVASALMAKNCIHHYPSRVGQLRARPPEPTTYRQA